jgi:hypothetical protein
MWETAVERWNTATETQKSIALAVLIVVVALGVAGVVRAENAPKSNFGVVRSINNPSTAFACYLSDGDAEMAAGTIHTCLVLREVGPGVLAVFGQVTFCTQTGWVEEQLSWSCGKYEEMYRLATGI